MTFNDLEPPKRGFSEFFAIFGYAAHTSTLNCDEMAGDRLKQPAHEISNIKHRF